MKISNLRALFLEQLRVGIEHAVELVPAMPNIQLISADAMKYGTKVLDDFIAEIGPDTEVKGSEQTSSLFEAIAGVAALHFGFNVLKTLPARPNRAVGSDALEALLRKLENSTAKPSDPFGNN